MASALISSARRAAVNELARQQTAAADHSAAAARCKWMAPQNTQRNSPTVAAFRPWRGSASICRSSVPSSVYHRRVGAAAWALQGQIPHASCVKGDEESRTIRRHVDDVESIAPSLFGRREYRLDKSWTAIHSLPQRHVRTRCANNDAHGVHALCEDLSTRSPSYPQFHGSYPQSRHAVVLAINSKGPSGHCVQTAPYLSPQDFSPPFGGLSRSSVLMKLRKIDIESSFNSPSPSCSASPDASCGARSAVLGCSSSSKKTPA